MIYLIKCDEYYKIGISSLPEERVKNIQTSNPHRVELIYKKDVISNRGFEKLLHKKYSSKRIRNEWFKLSLEDIKKIIYDIESFSWISKKMEVLDV